MDNENSFKVDFRKRLSETRKVRKGNVMLMQFRNGIINLDGAVEYGDWITSSVITNYGDCFDEKQSFWKRLFGA